MLKMYCSKLDVETCNVNFLVDPDCDVGEDSAVLGEVEVPQALLNLLRRAPRLELPLARVLLEVVEDPEHVREPQRLHLLEKF